MKLRSFAILLFTAFAILFTLIITTPGYPQGLLNGDNLGNHKARKTLNMQHNAISSFTRISNDDVSASISTATDASIVGSFPAGDFISINSKDGLVVKSTGNAAYPFRMVWGGSGWRLGAWNSGYDQSELNMYTSYARLYNYTGNSYVKVGDTVEFNENNLTTGGSFLFRGNRNWMWRPNALIYNTFELTGTSVCFNVPFGGGDVNSGLTMLTSATVRNSNLEVVYDGAGTGAAYMSYLGCDRNSAVINLLSPVNTNAGAYIDPYLNGDGRIGAVSKRFGIGAFSYLDTSQLVSTGTITSASATVTGLMVRNYSGQGVFAVAEKNNSGYSHTTVVLSTGHSVRITTSVVIDITDPTGATSFTAPEGYRSALFINSGQLYSRDCITATSGTFIGAVSAIGMQVNNAAGQGIFTVAEKNNTGYSHTTVVLSTGHSVRITTSVVIDITDPTGATSFTAPEGYRSALFINSGQLYSRDCITATSGTFTGALSVAGNIYNGTNVLYSTGSMRTNEIYWGNGEVSTGAAITLTEYDKYSSTANKTMNGHSLVNVVIQSTNSATVSSMTVNGKMLVNTSSDIATVSISQDSLGNNAYLLDLKNDRAMDSGKLMVLSFNDSSGMRGAITCGYRDATGTVDLYFHPMWNSGAIALTPALSKMMIMGNGNVGIGNITPGDKLQVYGGITASSGSYNGDFMAGSSTGMHWVNATPSLGIGVSNPSGRLQVAGGALNVTAGTVTISGANPHLLLYNNASYAGSANLMFENDQGYPGSVAPSSASVSWLATSAWGASGYSARMYIAAIPYDSVTTGTNLDGRFVFRSGCTANALAETFPIQTSAGRVLVNGAAGQVQSATFHVVGGITATSSASIAGGGQVEGSFTVGQKNNGGSKLNVTGDIHTTSSMTVDLNAYVGGYVGLGVYANSANRLSILDTSVNDMIYCSQLGAGRTANFVRNIAVAAQPIVTIANTAVGPYGAQYPALILQQTSTATPTIGMNSTGSNTAFDFAVREGNAYMNGSLTASSVAINGNLSTYDGVQYGVFLSSEGGIGCWMKNLSGHTSITGEVVMPSSGTTFAAAQTMGYTTSTLLCETPIGIVYSGGVANGNWVPIITNGRAQVLLSTTVCSIPLTPCGVMMCDTAGRATWNVLEPSAFTHINIHWREVGHSIDYLGTDAASTLRWCQVHFN